MRRAMSFRADSTAPAIECIGLSRRIGGALVVDDVTFSVPQGETYVVLGPNGAGKSSLLEVLATLHPPATGTVRILGLNGSAQAHRVRQQIGVVFQRTTLDDRLTARENLRIHAALHGLPRGEMDDRVRQALEWAELVPAAGRLVRELSGGMKRRLEIARALLHRPAVLLLDEPTAGLDPHSRAALLSRIASLSKTGLAVFATTHDLAEAARSNMVGIMAKGRLVADGRPEQLGLASEAGATDLEAAYLRLTGRRATERPEPQGVIS